MDLEDATNTTEYFLVVGRAPQEKLQMADTKELANESKLSVLCRKLLGRKQTENEACVLLPPWVQGHCWGQVTLSHGTKRWP